MKTKKLVYGAVIAALYAALTLALAPISYGMVQFRVSEVLTVLPFFMSEAVPGLTIGCLIANLYSGNVFDIVFGTLATLLAACVTYCIGKAQHGEFSLKKSWFAPLPAVIFNALIVGAVLAKALIGTPDAAPFYIVAAWVGLGELGVCYILGLPFMSVMQKIKKRIL